MKSITLFFLVFSISFTLGAQVINPRAAEVTTIGITDAQLFDQLMVTVPGVGRSARDLLESQSLKPYMMPVRKVGFRGTELSYAVAGLLEYYVNLNKNYKVNLSPDYVAVSLVNSGKQVNIPEALKFLAQNGTVSAAIMPYDADAVTGAVYATQKYQVTNYLHLFREQTHEKQRVFETTKALKRGNPVLVEVRSDESIKMQKDARFLKVNGGAQSYPLIVVGYDESDAAFEVLSCWGSSWGAGGYSWIKYDDFGKAATNGYVLIPFANY